MDTPYTQTITEVLASMRASPHGLSLAEVAERMKSHRQNVLPAPAPPGALRIFLQQFLNPLMALLVVAALVSVWLRDTTDAIVIAMAALLNALVGWGQEWRASKALEQLRSLIQPTCFVRRDGATITIPSKDVVPGDIVLLETGERIPADARVIASYALEVNEASLTGESLPVQKHTQPVRKATPLAERTCMVYAGTIVAAGRGEAVVVETGKRTELGKIAALVTTTEEPVTPLQSQLGRLSRWIAVLAVVCATLIYFVSVSTGQDPREAFRVAVAVAVGAIPEGLLLSVTVVLAVGMQRILARGSLVRSLVAAETLGSVSVICTDKTGTLTAGEMDVAQTVLASGQQNTSDTEGIRMIFETVVLCNDADTNGHGSPTERALIHAAAAFGMNVPEVRAQLPRVAEIPFSSARKFMATRHTDGNSDRLCVKGAPERILPLCTHIRILGHDRVLDAKQRTDISQRIQQHAQRGQRVMTVATAQRSHASALQTHEIQGLTLLGWIALHDPLREEVQETIAQAAKAGIRTILVTGDHPSTAMTVAESAGIETVTHDTHQHRVVTGTEVDAWSDEELRAHITEIAVFARVEPRHKIRIVQAWRAHGAVVAMTGDGVNDAPALKAADVGVALGSGTDAAKEASDIVLLDNRLSTVTAAVEEGRTIFENIRKMTAYLLADSFTELVLIGGAMFLGLPLPLTALQILWINLVADTLPNAALTLEPGEPGLMNDPPRKRAAPVVDQHMRVIIFVIGVITDIVLFAVYAWVLHTGYPPDHARTVMFAAVGFDSLAYVFAVRSFHRPLWRIPFFSNPWLLVAVVVSTGLMFIGLFFPPLQPHLGTVPLDMTDVGMLIVLSLMKLAAIESVKYVWNHKRPAVAQLTQPR